MSKAVSVASEKAAVPDYFKIMAEMEHEQLVFCNDADTGLKAIIGIHSTVLGPAMGGSRMWNYNSTEAAVVDVLRLARGMTYKSALAGLNVGGGKAVLIGDPNKLKSEAYFRRFGKFIESLNGKYITAGDVNITVKDLAHIRTETRHVTGLPESMGGSGSSSIITAYGTYMGIKAAVKYAYGSDSLEGKKVAVQGVGAVGIHLLPHLRKENAEVFVSDIEEERLQFAAREHGAHIVSEKDIYDLDVDVFSPCALGAVINDDTIYRLKCQVIAGAANNQLADEEKHGALLQEKGIVYAPDFVVNAGGIMAVAAEYFGEYDKDLLYQKAENIYDHCLHVLHYAQKHAMIAQKAAILLAEQRITQIGNLKKIM